MGVRMAGTCLGESLHSSLETLQWRESPAIIRHEEEWLYSFKQIKFSFWIIRPIQAIPTNSVAKRPAEKLES